MDVEISTSDPDHVDPARVAAALQAANLFVLTVTVNEDIDGAWVYDPAADVIDEAMGDRPPGYEDCGCDPKVGHTQPCLLTPIPVPSLTRVHFQPEAWIGDQAVEVDTDWDQDEWYVSFETANAIIHARTEHSDGDLDFVRDDPFTPRWCREWTGPYTITVVEEHR